MHATPVNELHTACDDLETKIMRYTMEHAQDSDSENEEYDEQNPNSQGDQRKTLAKLRSIGRKHHAPVFRIPQGPPGKVKKEQEPKCSSGNNFEVFVETSEFSAVQVAETTKDAEFGKGFLGSGRVEDSLKEDPDYQANFFIKYKCYRVNQYQALFGFFDYREKVDLHFSNEENLSKAGKQMENCKIKIRNPPEIEPEFEVFNDDSTSLNLNEKQKSRLRLKLRKAYVKEMSIEEGYAKRILAAKTEK